MARKITDQHLDAYERDGFVKVESFLDSGELDEFTNNVSRFIRNVIPSMPREHVFYESRSDKSTLKQFQNIAQNDAYFRSTERSLFEIAARRFLNGSAVFQDMQYFNKPRAQADTHGSVELRSKATPPHQDGYYFMLEPCEAITMWLSLDAADQENGCLRYIPGSHKRPMREHARTSTLGFSQGIVDYGDGDLTDEIEVVTRPGDLVIHHAMTVHRADANRSLTRQRRSIGVVYYSENACRDEAAHEAYRIKLQREMLEQGKI